MTWPWVSSRAYGQVCSERDRQLEINATLLAELVSIARVRVGLREKRSKERPPTEPMPEEIRNIINRWESEPSRRQMRQQVAILRRSGKSWDQIEAALLSSLI